eukprot:3932915-Rhodomonas_salina.1
MTLVLAAASESEGCASAWRCGWRLRDACAPSPPRASRSRPCTWPRRTSIPSHSTRGAAGGALEPEGVEPEGVSPRPRAALDRRPQHGRRGGAWCSERGTGRGGGGRGREAARVRGLVPAHAHCCSAAPCGMGCAGAAGATRGCEGGGVAAGMEAGTAAPAAWVRRGGRGEVAELTPESAHANRPTE